ncbi:tetratricopeptide repeat protein [Acetobacter pasteurianus]|uniref:Uncharacterized protein n=1 Tax=Acetobacter pasteurianus NBRC 3188 TaxID=1226663 RepID=A0A401WXP6_ACEPA|nr:tetratricopeptide repeat protein [Acetobacter pasteurianus]GCD54142.1 hypothetical protein NBRC3188_2839 [Acetobacter pasteurianus NBRC 3188]
MALEPNAEAKQQAVKITAVEFTIACEHLFAAGEGHKAIQMALQVGQASQEVPLILSASGLLAKYTNRHDIVATLIKKAIHLTPDGTAELARSKSEMHIFLADALMAMGRKKEAMDIFQAIFKECPALRVTALEHISMALLEAGYPKEAFTVLDACFSSSDALVSVPLYNNMGCALERMNRSEEALPYYEKALELDPTNPVVSFGHSVSLLKAGRLEEGFKKYVRRAPLVNDRNFWFLELPRLSDQVDLEGKHILLYQEQGLGDTIQFIRFVPWLLSKGAKLTIALPIQLLDLIALNYQQTDCMLISDVASMSSAQRSEFDFSCPIPDLPFVCGVKSEKNIPHSTPYLLPSGVEGNRFSQIMREEAKDICGSSDSASPLARIGIVWAGDKRTKAADVAADQRRSTTLLDMMGAVSAHCPDLRKCEIYNLQFGRRRSELKEWHGLPIIDIMNEVENMEDTAAIMLNLDLIISVDTSTAHLAGALGRPIWMVSRWDACWRWGDKGDRSVWYPTMRVFRAQENSFLPVLAEVGKALQVALQNSEHPVF